MSSKASVRLRLSLVLWMIVTPAGHTCFPTSSTALDLIEPHY